MPRQSPDHRARIDEAVRRVEADAQRSTDTRPGEPDVQLHLEDESVHPTGDLKNRLARSLLLQALRRPRW